MPFLLIRHKVENFDNWLVGYHADAPIRKKMGIIEDHLMRNLDDPDEVFILFADVDVEKLREFAASEELRDFMKMIGVIEEPDFHFLEEAASFPE